MVELLSPAGSFEALCAAVNAGADAVYIGGSMFGARAYADNPDEDMLIRGIEYCHLRGRKLYLTVNTLLKENELESMLYPYLVPYYRNGLDGVIVQDLGVVKYIQEFFPDLDVHASTQMTITGADGAGFLKRQGITRVVPARELSLAEVREIIEKTGIEVETFIHGAMCYSYSGQCLLSSMIGGRSGNRGRCAQPCRLPYSCQSGKGKYFGYLLSMKDMCTIDLIPDLIDAGIASMKIEGRMKRPEYAAGVVSVYRKYIDLYQKYGREGYQVSQEDRQILMDLYNRGGFSGGYYERHNGPVMMSVKRPNHFGTEAARIKEIRKGSLKACALEVLHQKDVLEFPDGKEITLGKEIKAGALFDLQANTGKLKSGDILRRTRNEFLLQELQERYMKENLQVKIKGDLRIFPDGSAILKLLHEDISVEYRDCIAEPAQNNPTTEDSIRKQLNKTGGTSFRFERLSISVADGLFVPVKKLNELRRGALAALEQQILDQSRRSSEKAYHSEHREEKADHSAGRTLNISVARFEQLEAVLNQIIEEVDIVYLDSLLLGYGTEADASFRRSCDYVKLIHEKGMRCFLNLPPVFRSKERTVFGEDDMRSLLRQFDGFLLHTVDEYAYMKKMLEEKQWKAILAADDNFYMYNTRTVNFWYENGISSNTLPVELNWREQQQLSRKSSELTVYGYQPLMHSAQCVTANTSGCSRTPQILWLKDRKNMQFPVINRCPSCCNTIYNSVPLELDGCRDEISKLDPAALRLSFTVESGRETSEILKYYHGIFFEGCPVQERKNSGTKGHFKRGVE